MYIDEAHFRGHKHCSPAYNTGKRFKLLCTDVAGCFNSGRPFRITTRPLLLTTVELICCWAAGRYEHFVNSPFAEQKNSRLRAVEPQVSYMKQSTFMWYMRYMLYCMNQLDSRSAQEQCFFWRTQQ